MITATSSSHVIIYISKLISKSELKHFIRVNLTCALLWLIEFVDSCSRFGSLVFQLYFLIGIEGSVETHKV